MKNKIPQFPKKLPGTFWGITTFFNPAGYNNKYENYKIFRESSKKQGLNLCAVELAFGKAKFELKKDDAEILIQIRGNENNIMWQKERMFNIALESLPKDCDKIVWLDCDVLFENEDWINETSHLLERYVVVQPFAMSIRLLRDNKILSDPEILPIGDMEGHKLESRAYKFAETNIKQPKVYLKSGHTGYAWAGRKEVFDKHGFYDQNIIGSGDLFMAHAYYAHRDHRQVKLIPKKTLNNYYLWKERIFNEVKGSVWYTKGVLYHLWHGSQKSRNYFNRYLVMEKYDFDSGKDMRIGENKLWEWSSDKPELHSYLIDYFFLRNEERSINRFFKFLFSKYFWNPRLAIARTAYHDKMGKIGLKMSKNFPELYKKIKSKKEKIEKKILSG